MGSFLVKKGFDIDLSGKPLPELSAHALVSTRACLYPREFVGLKQRLKVEEGDSVARGTELVEDKRDERFKLRSPAGGTVKAIIRGKRRFVEQIVIDIDDEERVEEFESYGAGQMSGLDRDTILNQLINTGYLAFIRQRPFSKIADPGAVPKSIFVNGMNTAPFQVDAGVAVCQDGAAFQAGLDLLGCLTDGPVHLCVGHDAGAELILANGVEVHMFSGPHPSGNTSVHISRLDPIVPHDVVWTVQAADLVLIGRLFLDGVLPQTRVVSLGGPGTKDEARKHYLLRIGGDMDALLPDAVLDGEMRYVSGDILSGTATGADDCLRFYQSSTVVLPEGRDRVFLGWLAPGFDALTASRAYVSSWLARKTPWNLDTNRHGDRRALVLTGYYDKVMPMNIMVDYLLRAVLAGDNDEAISLGILETDPEDFALCEFICPSKTKIQEIIRDGLGKIEEEGL
jgi:Na+-transporting NADH:ubiquinone oxidoreductase subunit A